EALGVQKIEELAAQAKMKASEVPQALSSLLPQIIDKLTPDGKEPENGIAATAVNLLKGLQSRLNG
ncbi:MAG TPA: YidB family protein, partial [Turneriella sp.]|nr:YidB family protein [Turneriella sp.]